jgi:tetratricopeptide (TPR) repeat protein
VDREEELNRKLRRAEEAEEEEKLEEALSLYNEILQEQPDHGEALLSRGIVLFRMESFEKALADFLAAAKLEPEEAHLWYNAGLASARKYDYHRAVEYYHKALEIFPEHLKTLYARAEARMDLDEYEAAEEDLRRAAEFLESRDEEVEEDEEALFEDIDFRRGLCFERLGRYEEALEVYRRAWNDSEDLVLIPRLVYLSYLLERDEEVRSWLLHTKDFDEAPPELTIVQAAFHLAAGEKDAAERAIRSLDTFDEEGLDL